ncbi:MAG: 16S rRNA (uracil(1498)-N(3))-methyltransferase [Lentisphaeria bacterium]|nr:16S rRNA (uracil(1498)-N(3))-methyltransferase [Lentisphaeria bacterium]
MNLLLLDPAELEKDGTVRLDGYRAEHIFCILHAQKGDRLRAGLLNGNTGTAEVLESTRHSAILKTEGFPVPPVPESPLIPVIALPRPQSFKKTLHFLASCGIRTAFFTGAARVEKSYWKSASMQPEAVRGELINGLEQGGCTVLPDIRFRASLRELFDDPGFQSICGCADKLVAHPGNAVPCPGEMKRTTLCAIGPEGGFLQREVDFLERNGFTRVSLGPCILRVEFALAALYGRLSRFVS